MFFKQTVVLVATVAVVTACVLAFVLVAKLQPEPAVIPRSVESHVPSSATATIPAVASSVSVLFLGDTMFERQHGRPDIDVLQDFFTSVQPVVSSSDIVTLNLEGVIAPPAAPIKTFDFAFSDYYAELLATYNIDAVSLANNHSLDQGVAGYGRTVELLHGQNIGTYGHQTIVSAPVYTEYISGQSVALVGFNFTHPGIQVTDVEAAMQSVVELHDIVMVYVHWGEEYGLYPNHEQREWATVLAEAGADAIIGAHPHVTQGMSIIRDVPVLWSLGNFVFDQYFSEEVRQGMAVQLTQTSTSTWITPYPYQISGYTPRILEGAAARTRLEAFLDRSDVSPETVIWDENSVQIVIPRDTATSTVVGLVY